MHNVTPEFSSDSAFALSDCVVSLLADAGCSIDRADVLGALGYGLMVGFTQSLDGPVPVAADCHDFALTEAAAIFGVRLRAMHPASARHGLIDSAEFAVHFADSYVPLIQRAIQNGQSVLCLEGWPADLEATWGIANRSDGDSLWGNVPGYADSIPINEPSLQCYVVEEISPIQPSPDAILTCGVLAARQLHERGSRIHPGLMMASEIFGTLIEVLKSDGAGTPVETARMSFPLKDYGALFRLLEKRRDAASRIGVRVLLGVKEEMKNTTLVLAGTCSNDAIDARALLKYLAEASVNDHETVIESLKRMIKHERDILKLCESLAELAAPVSGENGTMA